MATKTKNIIWKQRIYHKDVSHIYYPLVDVPHPVNCSTTLLPNLFVWYDSSVSVVFFILAQKYNLFIFPSTAFPPRRRALWPPKQRTPMVAQALRPSTSRPAYRQTTSKDCFSDRPLHQAESSANQKISVIKDIRRIQRWEDFSRR